MLTAENNINNHFSCCDYISRVGRQKINNEVNQAGGSAMGNNELVFVLFCFVLKKKPWLTKALPTPVSVAAGKCSHGVQQLSTASDFSY